MVPKSLKLEDQLDLFEKRGMILTDQKKNLEKLKHISYYRLKDFAAPYGHITMYGEVPVLKYCDITFDDVVNRYYRDKNLRINLFHAIEKIEVSLKRNISYLLGSKYGAYGYLDFSNWCDKKHSRYEIEKKQFFFKKDLLKSVKRSKIHDLKNDKNFNEDKFPSIWIATEVMMFGTLINLVEIMSKSNQRRLADFYNCTNKELVSWLKCLNLVRNVCAHNSNIIDIQLKTRPILRAEWIDKYLYTVKDKAGNEIVTNRIAAIILITISLVKEINKRYRWKSIRSNLASICLVPDKVLSDKNANLLGFADSHDALDLKSFARGKY